MRKILLATMFSLGAVAAYADPPGQVPTVIEPTAPAPNPSPPTTLRCTDGTQSTTSASGACAHHGGVAKPDDRREPVDPYASPGTRCLDGWLSPMVGRGACAQHGGVMHGGPIPQPPAKTPPRPTPDPIMPTSQIGTRCLDGTLAMTSDRNACVKHGGAMRGHPLPPAAA